MLTKLALGNTSSEVFIDGLTTITLPGAAPTTEPGSKLALPSNMGRYEQDSFSMVPELTARVNYQITPCWHASLAYTFVYWSHVARAGNQIDLDDDPVMRDAVIKSIEERLARGGAGTGWSRAWTIGMFARFSDGERAYENLHAILTRSTLDNLWDNHPPFQIDGNFGATAAVAEMLLHSHNDEIKLLPALPAKWPSGRIQGLKARGDYTVDIRWKDGALAEAVIHASESSPEKLRVVYNGLAKQITLKPAGSVSIVPEDF